MGRTAKRAAPIKRASQTRLCATARRRSTVLIVEDYPSSRNALRALLEGSGYRVLEAQTAEQALRICDLAPCIDLLVADINIAHRIRPRLVSRVRAKTALRGTVITADLAPHDEPGLSDLLRESNTVFMTKPIDYGELEEELARMLAE